MESAMAIKKDMKKFYFNGINVMTEDVHEMDFFPFAQNTPPMNQSPKTYEMSPEKVQLPATDVISLLKSPVTAKANPPKVCMGKTSNMKSAKKRKRSKAPTKVEPANTIKSRWTEFISPTRKKKTRTISPASKFQMKRIPTNELSLVRLFANTKH